MSSESEKKLIRSICAGDPGAFQTLYQNYGHYVYNRCLLLSRNPSIAEDLSQEVFIHIWRKITGFRGESTLKTWIYRIATNTALLYLRRVRARVNSGDCVSFNDGKQIIEKHRTAPYSRPEDVLLIRELMPKLSRTHRITLILHDIKGYKHNEIGRMLGIPVGTSKSNLSRARNQIKSILRESSISKDQPRVA